MLLWIGFAIITAAVVAALARPFGRPRDGELDSRAADLAVYKDQLTEIEAEKAGGLIGTEEAESARAEVARRMLARAEQAGSPPPAPGSTPAPGAGARASIGTWQAIAVATIPLTAALIYVAVGSPFLPDLPHAQRTAARPDRGQIADLIAKVEARLKEHPEDGQGWEVLGPVYRKFERFPEAAMAFRRAIAILGPSPKRLWGLAESLIEAQDGLVSDEARQALEKVVAAEPGRLDARFWLAAAKEQDGKQDAAAAEYTALIGQAEPGSPLRLAAEDRLKAMGVAPPAGAPAVAAHPPAKGPSGADLAAAAQMTPEARGEMVEKMVAGLADRLKADGRDLAGWQKLVKAYKVLGRDADARKALADARATFKGDGAALAELDVLAKSVGLGG